MAVCEAALKEVTLVEAKGTEQVPNTCFFFAEKMSRWMQKMLQAAACQEVSAANPLSVLIKDSRSTKKRVKWRRKKTNWMLNSWLSEGTGIQSGSRWWTPCYRNQMISKAQAISRMLGTNDWLGEGGKRIAWSPSFRISLASPLHRDREQYRCKGACVTTSQGSWRATRRRARGLRKCAPKPGYVLWPWGVPVK